MRMDAAPTESFRRVQENLNELARQKMQLCFNVENSVVEAYDDGDFSDFHPKWARIVKLFDKVTDLLNGLEKEFHK